MATWQDILREKGLGEYCRDPLISGAVVASLVSGPLGPAIEIRNAMDLNN